MFTYAFECETHTTLELWENSDFIEPIKKSAG